MVRRSVAAGVGVVLLIAIVLIVNGCLKSQKTQALEDYNHNVSRIVGESDQQVSRPLFSALSGASAKPALDEVNQLRLEAEKQAKQAQGLSVPGEMNAAQRDLLLALDLRAEGVEKVANRLRTASGSQAKQASTLIAGDMEMFLASDVIYSQRVAPLIEQALRAGGARGASVASSHFLPNIGWLEPNTVLSRITGQPASSGQAGALAPGSHGSALVGVSVGANTLASEPTLNHISGGSSPTFTVAVENAGESTETNIKVDVAVAAQGSQLKATKSIDSLQAGTKANVEIPVEKVPTGVASKVEVNIEPVAGETSTENNKSTYLAIFGQ